MAVHKVGRGRRMHKDRDAIFNGNQKDVRFMYICGQNIYDV